MRKVAIIGAGYSGLKLGIALLQHSYHVTIFSDKSSDEFLHGHIMSSQGLFNTALASERALGINFWEEECPNNQSVSFAVAGELGKQLVNWKGYTSNPFTSVDQRLKFSKWLSEFTRLGGITVIERVDAGRLDELSSQYDLCLVSTGKGELGQIFEKNEERSVHQCPPRRLACFYVKGMKPDNEKPGLHVNIAPGLGEYFSMPGLTLNGACEMMLFEAIPNGPFDIWAHDQTAEVQLMNGMTLLKQYLPWEYDRCQHVSLADEKAFLIGGYTPVVRTPYAKMKNANRFVMGMADAIVLNDPNAGQGANNASRCAAVYLASILAHGDQPFHKQWMAKTFDAFWQYAQWSTRWSNLLLEPLPKHIVHLLMLAAKHQSLANLLSDSFDHVDQLFPWIEDAVATQAIIQSIESNGSARLNQQTFNTIYRAIQTESSVI